MSATLRCRPSHTRSRSSTLTPCGLVHERSRFYFPYFSVDVAYDNRRCRETLAPAGIHPKPLRDYFDRLVEFALLAQWGRRQISRAEVARVRSPRLLRDAQGSERLGPVGMHLDADDQAVAQRELVRH